MSAIPKDHAAHLQRRPFAFRCSVDIFPADEREALVEYGNWLEALVAGTIKPVTAEQKHFLKVAREEAEPKTVCERAWVRLQGRRDYEHEQEIAPPHEPPVDYGIVEVDEDRCWW
jgi:uncharacterized protein YifE (UPF0438 family)